MPRDNIGVVFGSKATLVIDAGITPSVGRIIQEKVSELTDRAIRFLVNTTYHGDHTFGNVAHDGMPGRCAKRSRHVIARYASDFRDAV